MKILTSFINVVSSISAVLSGILIVGLTLIITFGVAARYVANKSIEGLFDIAGILLAAVIFLGLAYAFNRRAHIRMELVTRHLPRRLQTWLRLVTYLIGLGFLVVFTSQGWTFALRSYHENARTFTDLPLYIPLLVMAIGLSLLGMIVLLTVCRYIWLMVGREEGGNFSEVFGKGDREET